LYRIVSYVSATNPTIEVYKQLEVGYISQRKLKQDAVAGGRLRPLLPPPGGNGGRSRGSRDTGSDLVIVDRSLVSDADLLDG